MTTSYLAKVIQPSTLSLCSSVVCVALCFGSRDLPCRKMAPKIETVEHSRWNILGQKRKTLQSEVQADRKKTGHQ